jgi:hypothetical protein
MMLEEMIAYMELHELSLLQDAEKLQDLMSNYEYNYDSDEYRELEITDMNNTGELIATRHLLSVARDILLKTNERN